MYYQVRVYYIAHKPPEYHTHRDFNIVHTDYSVRLVDGTASNEGRVEVVKSGQYSTICLDQWDQNLADVVCHQLGFTLLAEEAFLNFGAVFGEGTGPILDDDLVCSGSEEFISHCSKVPANIGGCNHSRDASVRCSGKFACSNSRKPTIPNNSMCAGDLYRHVFQYHNICKCTFLFIYSEYFLCMYL